MPDSYPLISVLVLCYKSFSGLWVTLKSILEQDYPNIELIISDDGSPNFCEYKDEIENYIANNKKVNLRSITIDSLPENVGTVKNINHALKKARGEYIKLLSPYDYLIRNDTLHTYYEYIGKTKALLVAAQAIPYDIKTNECLKPSPGDKIVSVFKDMSSRSQYIGLLERFDFVHAVTVFFKAKFFEQCGYMNENYKYIEDDPCWLNATNSGVKIHFLIQPTVMYGLSGMSSDKKSEFSKVYNIERQRLFIDIATQCNVLLIYKKLLLFCYRRECEYCAKVNLKGAGLSKRLLQVQYFDYILFKLYRILKLNGLYLRQKMKHIINKEASEM